MKRTTAVVGVYFALLTFFSLLPLGDAHAKKYEHGFNCPCVPVESAEYNGRMCKCDKYVYVTPRAHKNHGDTYTLRCTGPTAFQFPAHVEDFPRMSTVKHKRKEYSRGCRITGNSSDYQQLECLAGVKRWGASGLSFNLEVWCMAP